MPDNIWIGDCPAKGPSECAPEWSWAWDGLVGLWAPAIGPTGNALFDMSGRNNHGTMQNMDPATDWIGSPYGWALDFDATNDVITMSGPSRNASVVSIALGVMVHSDPGATVVWLNFTEAIRPYIGFFANFVRWKAAGTNYNVPMSYGVWYNMLMTNDGATSIIYLNGVQQGSVADTLGAGRTLRINATPVASQLAYVGIWDTVLNLQHAQLLAADPFALLRPAGFGAELWYPGGTPPVSSIPAIYDYYRRLRCA